ncbi:MAG: hypothetical protein SWK76_00845 [Actinomycetota bacterium]|nr:hypothetical protein [Actinomycetota bacterium]
MKVIVLKPSRVFLAGVLSALMVFGGVLGTLALVGVFTPDTAEAYGPYDPGVGAKTWYFAEGYTGEGFEEWILVYNPPSHKGGSGETFSVDLDFYGPDGHIGFFNGGRLEPGQRASFNINELAMDWYGYSGDISVIVYHPDYPFIAERALYFDYKGKWAGGSQVLGYQEGAAE